MRQMIWGLALTAAGVGLSAGDAAAQLKNVPIDTTALIVKPGDTATNIFAGTAKIINRAVADAVDSNGFVKTLNNLLGRRPEAKQTTQPNGLPVPSLYPSTQYPNSFQPVMPTAQRFGQSVPTRR